MNYFLVDYENVNATGLNGVSGLPEEDTVIIFYSEKAETLTFGLHRRLNESKATISFQRVQTGVKNALDLQLCTCLGYLIGQNAQSPATYYIVSADQDYTLISAYWKRQKVNVSLISEISVAATPADNDSAPTVPAPTPTPADSDSVPTVPAPTPTPADSDSVPTVPAPTPTPADNNSAPIVPAPTPTPEDMETFLKVLLPKKYKDYLPIVAEIVRRCKTKKLVSGELVRIFHQGADNSVPSEIYQSIKSILPS